MNLREGTRRLALLLGGLGAIAGGVLSYVYLQPVMRQREMHKSFEQLANSNVVKEQRKALHSPDPYASIAKPISGLPPGAILKPIPQHGRAKLSDIAPSSPPVEWDANGKPIAATTSTAPPTGGDFLDGATPLSSEVNKGDIKTINWDRDHVWNDASGIYSIETDGGQILYPTAAPSAWLYLFAALFPILGFFFPWGAVRAIGWVGAGFAASSK